MVNKKVSNLLGAPCNTSEGCHTQSKSQRATKVNLAHGHAKGGSWPSGAHVTGVSGDTDKMGRHGSHLD